MICWYGRTDIPTGRGSQRLQACSLCIPSESVVIWQPTYKSRLVQGGVLQWGQTTVELVGRHLFLQSSNLEIVMCAKVVSFHEWSCLAADNFLSVTLPFLRLCCSQETKRGALYLGKEALSTLMGTACFIGNRLASTSPPPGNGGFIHD